MLSWIKKLLNAQKARREFDEALNKELGEKYANLDRPRDPRLPLDPGKSELR